jgi:hypothetical protein
VGVINRFGRWSSTGRFARRTTRAQGCSHAADIPACALSGGRAIGEPGPDEVDRCGGACRPHGGAFAEDRLRARKPGVGHRKLEAGSRSQAVARAVDVGLLER